MTRAFVVLLIGMLGLGACQHKPSPGGFVGNWLCQNAIDSVAKFGSVVQSPLVPFEFVIRPELDSVLYLNTFEAALFPVQSLSDTQFQIKGFITDSASTFTLQPSGKLRLEPGGFEFVRADSSLLQPTGMAGWPSALERFFYQKLLAGIYEVKEAHLPDTLSQQSVIFADDQSVTGALRTARCRMLLGGDQANGGLDILSFRNSDSTYSTWGWQRKADALRIYTTKNTSAPNEKPYYEADKLVLVLKKK